MRGVPVEALVKVPLFEELKRRDVEHIARLFNERRFAAGDVVVKEGSGGVAFFVIGSGEARVSVNGKQLRKLKPGDYFGEIALIDGGARMATITATTDLVCYTMTALEFRPIIEENGLIGWRLLQQMAKMLRAAREGFELDPMRP